MTDDMKKTIDAVLDRVKDPESGLSISDLGLVKKIRYSDEHQHLYVFTDCFKRHPGCLTCSAIASLVSSSISKNLEKEFKTEFPDLTVEIL